MNLPIFIAGRYLFAKKSHNVINIISAISSIGMAIGTAALIIILSIYNGFDDLVTNMMGDIEPDILIRPSRGKVFVPQGKVYDMLYDDPAVKNMCTVLDDQVFLNYEGKQSLARAKGVDGIYEDETDLKEHVRFGEFSLHRGELYQTCVGNTLAYNLGINPNFVAPVRIYYPSRTKSFSLADAASALVSIDAHPSGTFSISADIDQQYIILPIEAMRELLDYTDEVSAVEIRIADGYGRADIRRIMDYASKELGDDFKVDDRYRQNESLYKMMRYEKASIYLILIFIIIIISLNIFGSLTMLIIEKRQDIEILRDMGATENLIRKTFTLEGWMISLLGLTAGLVLGIVISLIQQKFGIIKMPGNFTVRAYPVILSFKDIISTVAGVGIIGYIMAKIPVSMQIGKGKR